MIDSTLGATAVKIANWHKFLNSDLCIWLESSAASQASASATSKTWSQIEPPLDT